MDRLLFAGILATVVACDSSNTPTSEIYARIQAFAYEDGTFVLVGLYRQNPDELSLDERSENHVELSPNDELWAQAAGRSQRLNQSGGPSEYQAYFSLDVENVLTVQFRRSIDDGAPASIMTLPAPPEPLFERESVSRTEEIVIAWQPSETNDVVSWVASGSDCVEGLSGTFPDDPGLLVIPANTLTTLEVDDCPDDEAVHVSIRRSRDGILDPGYMAGTIRSEQSRSVTFTSTP